MAETFRSSIPLLCNLCPNNPTFSDVSHLLTHVSSKSHLATRFKLQVRSQGEPDARAQIEVFDNWYAENGIEDLLGERLAAKEQKKTTKRPRSVVVAQFKLESSQGEASSANAYPPGMPLMHTWATALPTASEAIPGFDDPVVKESMYMTPTTKRHLPNFGPQPSPSSDRMVLFNAGPIKLEEPLNEPDSAAATLKGIYWPGMDLFDSATAEMKRKRNQKKDISVLEQMKINSTEVEPTEWIFNPAGELERTRYIFDDSTNSSPAKSEREKLPSPKRRRSTRRSTVASSAAAALGDVSTNRPRLTQTRLVEKRPAAQRGVARYSTTMSLADMTYLGSVQPNPLNNSNMFYNSNAEEEEEFRMTVGDMGRKKHLTVLRDADTPSPGRTESPLEDHRFELQNDLPCIRTVQEHFSNDAAADPSLETFTLSPIRPQPENGASDLEHLNRPVLQPMMFQTMHNMPFSMQPMMMQPPFGVVRTQTFNNETINPLLFNAETQTYTGYPGYHDFQPFHQGYTNEIKSDLTFDPFRDEGQQESIPSLPFTDMNGNVMGADDMAYQM